MCVIVARYFYADVSERKKNDQKNIEKLTLITFDKCKGNAKME